MHGYAGVLSGAFEKDFGLDEEDGEAVKAVLDTTRAELFSCHSCCQALPCCRDEVLSSAGNARIENVCKSQPCMVSK